MDGAGPNGSEHFPRQDGTTVYLGWGRTSSRSAGPDSLQLEGDHRGCKNWDEGEAEVRGEEGGPGAHRHLFLFWLPTPSPLPLMITPHWRA